MRSHLGPAALVAAVAALLTTPPALADVPPSQPVYVFEAIDEVGTRNSSYPERYIVLSGLELGASDPVEEIYFPLPNQAAADRCDRYALLMMERPGRYLLEVSSLGSNWSCRLRVRTE